MGIPHSPFGNPSSKGGGGHPGFPSGSSSTFHPGYRNRKRRIPLERSHPAGLFEVFIKGKKEFPPYQVKVEYAGMGTLPFGIPMLFGRPWGRWILYLLGEGNHQKLHEKMGAHFIHWQGVEGVSFAVWAPSARGVSVVGDFNGWGWRRLHPMNAWDLSRHLGNIHS